MNRDRFAYEAQRAVAHVVAPVMRMTGFRFSKASRNNKLVCMLIDRVAANLLADGVKPGRMQF